MFEINDVSGKRYTILNFWATWCAPCVEEMPMLSEFHNKTKIGRNLGDRLAIDNEKTLRNFYRKLKLIINLSSQELRVLISWRRLD